MIWKTLSENKAGSGFIVAAVLLIVVMLTTQGCNPESYVKVDVPQRIQETAQVEARIPLKQAVPVFEDWKMLAERDAEQFSSNISEAKETVGFINSLFQLSLTAATDGATGGLPAGGLLSALLLSIGTYLLKRPGTDKEIADEKELSYNAGIAVGGQLGEKNYDTNVAPTHDLKRIEAESALFDLREKARSSTVLISEDLADPKTLIQNSLEALLVKALETMAGKANKAIEDI